MTMQLLRNVNKSMSINQYQSINQCQSIKSIVSPSSGKKNAARSSKFEKNHVFFIFLLEKNIITFLFSGGFWSTMAHFEGKSERFEVKIRNFAEQANFPVKITNFQNFEKIEFF